MKAPVELTVRPATLYDAERISHLSGQLGYPTTTAETARRLTELRRDGEHAVFVAESGGTLLGWIHVHLLHSLVTEHQAEIAGVITDEHYRGRGIGRVLLEHAELWAKSMRCRAVQVRSNVVRVDARAFYERLGYQATKSQQVFLRAIAASE